MDWGSILFLVIGLILLTIGAETLVRGASRLAAAFNISPLVIGLTVVAYGTSTPELAVSVQAGLSGNPDIAIANVIGSNIFNVLFILGVCALITPLVVQQQLVRFDVPLVAVISLLVWAMAADGRIEFHNGVILTLGIVAYTGWSIYKSRAETAAIQQEYAQEFSSSALTGFGQRRRDQLLLIVIGLALLVIGADWMIDGATSLARAFGVSDVVIGLTIVAAGTSLPEVATSIIATLRNERDIAIGNVIGSSIYNLLAILGIASLVTPDGLTVAPSLIQVDMPVMVVTALVCLPLFFTGMRVMRWEGFLLLGAYVAYTAYLILNATDSRWLHLFESFLMIGIGPPVAVAIAVSGLRQLRRPLA